MLRCQPPISNERHGHLRNGDVTRRSQEAYLFHTKSMEIVQTCEPNHNWFIFLTGLFLLKFSETGHEPQIDVQCFEPRYRMSAHGRVVSVNWWAIGADTP